MNLPPQSIESEESLLSAILLDSAVLPEIIGEISPDDFYRSAHVKIYTAIRALHKKGEPVDLVTVSNAMRSDGQLEEVGGATYLAKLTDSIPSAVNPPHYAKIIREKATLRRLIRKCNDISMSCYDNSGNASKVLEDAQAGIMSIELNSTSGLIDACELAEMCVEQIERISKCNYGDITGIPSGFVELDQMLSGWQNTDLIILAGRPAMGKTSFGWNCALNAAAKGYTTGIWELEMHRLQLGLKAISAFGKVDGQKFRRGGLIKREDWSQITQAAGKLSGMPILIQDNPTLDHIGIVQDMRHMKRKRGLKLAIIDYLQLMERGRDANASVTEITRTLKLAAKELEIPIILLSQLNRGLEQRSNKRPVLSDLRDSGAIEQDADVVVFIYRDEVYNQESPDKGTAELIVSKQRLGPIGTRKVAFQGQYSRFDDLARDYG
jgi:replicative DNA helicase